MARINIWNNRLGEQEAQAAYHAIIERCVSDGKIVSEMEDKVKQLLNVPYVIATPNGSSALLLALMAIGIAPGDEVIVPDVTFIATANAPKVLGATVVVADTEEAVPVIEEESVMQLITERTKAVIPVHVNGHIACTKSLKAKLHQKGIFVIDDACQAFMSGNKDDYAGNNADIACYSMGISKTVASGQGGFVTTHDEALFRFMKKIKTQGLKNLCERSAYRTVGFNFKMSDILAAVGLVQLGKIEDKVSHLWEINQLYRKELENVNEIKFIPRKKNELPWMTYILCKHRNQIKRKLEERDIEVREIGDCLHRATYLEARGNYIHSGQFEDHILVLPGGPDQTFENIIEVCKIIKEI